MMNHLNGGKFIDYQTRHGGEVMNRFWINLDSAENQAVLAKYIEENYNPWKQSVPHLNYYFN